MNLKEKTSARNIEITSDGSLKRRVDWKTFKGMVYQLKLINNRLLKQKHGSLDFTIRLPIKKYEPKTSRLTK